MPAVIFGDIPITVLPAASAVASANEFEISDGGTPKKVTSAQLLTYISAVQAFVTSGINGLATGQTTIVPAQSGKRFVPVGTPLAQLTAVTGSGTVATLSLGNNASSYNNVVAAVALTGLDTANELLNLAIVAAATAIDINTNPIVVNVSVAAAVYSVYTFRVLLFGYVL